MSTFSYLKRASILIVGLMLSLPAYSLDEAKGSLSLQLGPPPVLGGKLTVDNSGLKLKVETPLLSAKLKVSDDGVRAKIFDAPLPLDLNYNAGLSSNMQVQAGPLSADLSTGGNFSHNCGGDCLYYVPDLAPLKSEMEKIIKMGFSVGDDYETTRSEIPVHGYIDILRLKNKTPDGYAPPMIVRVKVVAEDASGAKFKFEVPELEGSLVSNYEDDPDDEIYGQGQRRKFIVFNQSLYVKKVIVISKQPAHNRCSKTSFNVKAYRWLCQDRCGSCGELNCGRHKHKHHRHRHKQQGQRYSQTTPSTPLPAYDPMSQYTLGNEIRINAYTDAELPADDIQADGIQVTGYVGADVQIFAEIVNVDGSVSTELLTNVSGAIGQGQSKVSLSNSTVTLRSLRIVPSQVSIGTFGSINSQIGISILRKN